MILRPRTRWSRNSQIKGEIEKVITNKLKLLTNKIPKEGDKLMEIKKETQLTTTENTEIVITNDNGLIKLENFADIKSRLTKHSINTRLKKLIMIILPMPKHNEPN